MSAEARKPLVAVIIPCLDEGRYLEQALASVLSQTHPNTLPVVVKDGVFPSPWLDGLAADGRLRLVELPNHQGTPNALNAGIAACGDADYIARLDADDIALPDRIARQVSMMEQTGPEVGMVAAPAKFIDPDGKVVETAEVSPVPHFTSEQLLERNRIVHSSILVRGNVLRALGGYDARCIRLQDYELYLRLALIYEIRVIDEPLVLYRVHSGQSGRKARPWAPYIRIITARRTTLASRLGQSLIRQRIRNLQWVTAQWLRWLGLRTAGYDLVVRRGQANSGGDDTQGEPE